MTDRHRELARKDESRLSMEDPEAGAAQQPGTDAMSLINADLVAVDGPQRTTGADDRPAATGRGARPSS